MQISSISTGLLIPLFILGGGLVFILAMWAVYFVVQVNLRLWPLGCVWFGVIFQLPEILLKRAKLIDDSVEYLTTGGKYHSYRLPFICSVFMAIVMSPSSWKIPLIAIVYSYPFLFWPGPQKDLIKRLGSWQPISSEEVKLMVNQLKPLKLT